MQTRGVTAGGPPVAPLPHLGADGTDVEVGIPVADAVSGEWTTSQSSPGRAVISTWHNGSLDRLGEAYGRLEGG